MNDKKGIFGTNLDQRFKQVKPVRKLTKFKPHRSRLEIHNFNKIKRSSVSSPLTTVTFRNIDGSKKVLPLNDAFVFDRDNKKVSAVKMIEKLNTLKHDFHAENYIIN